MQIRPLWPFFAVERLGLGKRDLKKQTCVSFISGLIFNFFIDIFLVSFRVEKLNFIIPLFSAPIPLFSLAPKGKHQKPFTCIYVQTKFESFWLKTVVLRGLQKQRFCKGPLGLPKTFGRYCICLSFKLKSNLYYKSNKVKLSIQKFVQLSSLAKGNL